MTTIIEAEGGQQTTSGDLQATPPGSAASTPPNGGDEARAPQIEVRGWPYLSGALLDSGWQQAVNIGPSMMGRQVAYALSASLQRASETAPSAPSPDIQNAPTVRETAMLALATLAENISAQQRTTLLEDVRTLRDPALRARALLLLAPHLPAEVRRRALREAWEALSRLSEVTERVRLLRLLLPMLRAAAEGELPSGVVAETLDLASSIPNPEARLRSLTALLPSLPPTVRIGILLAILDTIAALNQPDSQAGTLIALAPYLLGEVHHRALTVASRIREPAARARTLTALARYLPAALQPRLRAAALEAIATISSEEERAEALAIFAPHLEEMPQGEEALPVLLERALAIAINMTRRDAQARALVGLQARLPRNLQGEALAAVNTIPDEHMRAQLLAELAPSLPPDLAVAALAVAHDIRQRDARFLALAALAKNMPPKAAERTWLDALAVALALPRQLERVLALAQLIPNLPGDLRYRAISSALTAARSIPKESARVRALAALAPFLEGQLLANAIADAYALTNPLERVSALTALAPYLPEGDPQLQMLRTTLQGIREISVEYRRARALVNLAPELPPALIDEAATIALEIEDPYDRATTLIALLQRLEGEAHAAIAEQAARAASEIMDNYDRASALASLWTLATPARRQTILREVLTAVREIEDDYDRASGVAVLAPLLALDHAPLALPQESQVLRETVLAVCQLESSVERAEALATLVPYWINIQPTAAAYALWCEVLPLLSRRPVAHVLSDLAALTPVLREVGGDAALREATQAIVMARQW